METAAFFDRFSKEYESQDRYRYLFYRWMVKTIVRQVEAESCRILDIGTGTGNLALRLAMRYPNSRILGVDISSGMIKEAKAKCARMGLTNVRFEVSPVEALRIRRVGLAVSLLALHHVRDKKLVVSNVYARLTQNGKLVIGDWFMPTKDYEKEIDELRRKNPRLAKEFDRSWEDGLKGMSEEYGRRHPKEYPVSQSELAEIMREAGITRPKISKSMLPNFAVVVAEKPI